MRNIIIDTDPGIDDAIAILLAAKYFNILGITTVHGNATVDKTTKNALKVLEFSAMTHIPVVRGSEYPLVQPRYTAASIHGETGLDGPTLAEPTTHVQPGHAVDFIIDTALSNPDVTLVTIGPLTNIAMALHQEPRLKDHIKEISLMGGSTTYGNVTMAAEFNIWCDPEAAHIVFTSGVPIKMVGLNLTRQAAATPEVIELIRLLNNRVGKLVAEMLTAYSERLSQLFGLPGGSLHDPCAVAWLIDPSLIESEMLHVAIELRGDHTRGMTVCDQRGLKPPVAGISVGDGIRAGLAPNVEVGIAIDVSRFMDLLVDTLAQYP
jgi:inosine-uridine nucleoside N-ribohydrolase